MGPRKPLGVPLWPGTEREPGDLRPRPPPLSAGDPHPGPGGHSASPVTWAGPQDEPPDHGRWHFIYLPPLQPQASPPGPERRG
uniref:Uncharacterized protein n=1 Tax=Piliocolobus tephrosceles TaxID=591936 RepID=A0A8C9GZZ2_9PRIM